MPVGLHETIFPNIGSTTGLLSFRRKSCAFASAAAKVVAREPTLLFFSAERDLLRRRFLSGVNTHAEKLAAAFSCSSWDIMPTEFILSCGVLLTLNGFELRWSMHVRMYTRLSIEVT